ncbi:MAG: CapA family protein, partial [Solirubrobacterales bacterium]|nr:CapA family protein [Solirubrobacterales bacterium]
PGVDQTLQVLEQTGFRRGAGYFGAGSSPRAAWEPAVAEAGGQTVAVVGCTSIEGYEHRIAYVATRRQGGAAACEESRIHRTIARLKRRHDAVVMMVHGGFEYVRRPSVACSGMSGRSRPGRWATSSSTRRCGRRSSPTCSPSTCARDGWYAPTPSPWPSRTTRRAPSAAAWPSPSRGRRPAGRRAPLSSRTAPSKSTSRTRRESPAGRSRSAPQRAVASWRSDPAGRSDATAAVAWREAAICCGSARSRIPTSTTTTPPRRCGRSAAQGPSRPRPREPGATGSSSAGTHAIRDRRWPRPATGCCSSRAGASPSPATSAAPPPRARACGSPSTRTRRGGRPRSKSSASRAPVAGARSASM